MTDINWEYRKDEYLDLLHAVQSGVASIMKYEHGDTAAHSPKHLRVGINSALISSSALTKTLIEKEIITYEEWCDNLIELLKDEVAGYERSLSDKLGIKVTLQ